MPLRPLVIVLTAGMGAGHDQVGRELARRLKALRVDTRLVDIGELLPPGWGRGLTMLYRFMATRAQWLYQLEFSLQMKPAKAKRPMLGPLRWQAERRLSELVSELKPSLVLSTFHVCSQITGEMRARGKLEVPAISYILDFGVHALWANPGIDANLLLDGSQAQEVRRRGCRRPVVCGPVVRPCFHLPSPVERAQARASLGLLPHERCAVIVAGSWGVGRVDDTLRVLLTAENFVPVVVTGCNDQLRERLQRICHGRRAAVLGWVDDMYRLMTAADVVIENAGGLSAMEALASGTPVVTYRPIAGHGCANAEAMSAAGISRYAHNPAELVSALHCLASDSAERRRAVALGRNLFASDPAELVAGWASAGQTASQPDDRVVINLRLEAEPGVSVR